MRMIRVERSCSGGMGSGVSRLDLLLCVVVVVSGVCVFVL